MTEWATELEFLHSLGKAKKVVQQSCVLGVIRFDIQPGVQVREIDPDGGVPAMLLGVGSLAVVAASWPVMTVRACTRVLSAYIREAMCEGHLLNSAVQPVAVVAGGGSCSGAPSFGFLISWSLLS